jgi:nitrogen fixation protein
LQQSKTFVAVCLAAFINKKGLSSIACDNRNTAGAGLAIILKKGLAELAMNEL